MNLIKRIESELTRVKIEGVNYREISEKINVSKTTVWRVFNLEMKMNVEIISKLEEAGIINLFYGYSCQHDFDSWNYCTKCNYQKINDSCQQCGTTEFLCGHNRRG